MLDIGLGVRLIAVAAAPAPPVPAPPGKPPFPLSSSSLRHRCSSWWLANGNAHGKDTTTTSCRATRRKWWSDRDGSQEDYGSSSLEEDDYGYEGETAFSGFGLAEELFDESWFSKVFKMYGSVLPVMLVSMFAATGLKAFLMAMAIPLSQSAISFLLTRGKGNRDDWWMLFFKKNSRWRRPFQEEEYSSSRSYYEGRRRHNYQSWVSKDFADAAASTAVGADGNTKNSSSGGYGGWDELLDNNSSNNNAAAQEAKKRSSNSYSQLATLITARNRGLLGLGRKQMRMPRTRRRMPSTTELDSTGYKQAPLLMTRLLVAVFPFLGSWFRLL